MGAPIGPLHVRRSILIHAGPARVWEEFESFDRFAAWFGRGHRLHEFEPELGAQVDLSVAVGSERRHFGGQVVVWQTVQELTFESNWRGAHAWPAPTFITIRLTPLDESTLVEVLHHGFERLGALAADTFQGYEEGWDAKHLVALRGIVEA